MSNTLSPRFLSELIRQTWIPSKQVVGARNSFMLPRPSKGRGSAAITAPQLHVTFTADPSENTRVASENTRATSENTRVTSENTRVTSENMRVESENTRVTSENTRVTSENTSEVVEMTSAVVEMASAVTENTRVVLACNVCIVFSVPSTVSHATS